MYKRFYPATMKVSRERMGPMQRLIYEVIRTREGINQKEIARHLDISQQLVSYHVKAMEAAGIVRVVQYGKEKLCYPTED